MAFLDGSPPAGLWSEVTVFCEPLDSLSFRLFVWPNSPPGWLAPACFPKMLGVF